MAGCPEAWDLDIDGRYPDGSFPDDSYVSSSAEDNGAYTRTSYSLHYGYKPPKYAFNTIEELMSSDVFQKALTQALAHKDGQIRGLQKELLAAHNALDDGSSWQGMC